MVQRLVGARSVIELGEFHGCSFNWQKLIITMDGEKWMSDISDNKQVKSSKRQRPSTNTVKPKRDKSRHMEVMARTGVSDERLLAEHAFDPANANASTALSFFKHLLPDLSLQECAMVIKEDIQAVNNGNLDKLEGMLTGQATVLNAMFNSMARLAMHTEYLPRADAFMKIALKAQSQCRTTVEAIAEIKYPKSATFIRQANIAGQQQVNNGAGLPAQEKNITPTNELLTESTYATLDARGAGTTSGIDSGLETVEAVNRANH